MPHTSSSHADHSPKGEAVYRRGQSPHGARTDEALARMSRWAEARFGIFVHWGVSAVPAGWWKGRRVEGLSEWIQFKERIPCREYAALAGEFNPSGFDAGEWVRRVADAGAKYFVYTAKHHDGFAMYRSSVSDFNIADATPFGRDPLAELQEACREQGVMLGLYYSQMIDWADPDAIGPQCNDWDFDRAAGDFHRYWHRKAMPQLEELLTRYGPIGLLWFDMPAGIPAECAQEAFQLVRRLQPRAVVNSRLCDGGPFDYQSMDDNYFNNHLPDRDWETAATTNESWAYVEGADRWKPAAALCESIAYAVSRNGNYLLNVGPDASGRFPQPAVDQLANVGRWLRRAGDGIFAAGSADIPTTYDWGCVTRRGNACYLHVTKADRKAVTLAALSPAPNRAVDKASGESLDLVSHPNGSLTVTLASPTDALPQTIELQFKAPPKATALATQVPGEDFRLDVWNASRPTPSIHRWDFSLSEAGTYRVVLLSKESASHLQPMWWGDGLHGRLRTGCTEQLFTLSDDGREPYPILYYWMLIRSEIGHLHAASAGPQFLEIHGLPICDSKWLNSAVNMVGVRLERLP